MCVCVHVCVWVHACVWMRACVCACVCVTLTGGVPCSAMYLQLAVPAVLDYPSTTKGGCLLTPCDYIYYTVDGDAVFCYVHLYWVGSARLWTTWLQSLCAGLSSMSVCAHCTQHT